MNACYYNPSTARFLSQDTYTGSAFDPWTQHLYAYCNNNALTALDLSQNTKLTTLDCSGQQAAETRVLQQADGSGRADLSGLVPGWSGAQGVQVQGGTLEADGSTVETIEGIGTADEPHPLQQAFIDAGAIQCGYCTPGMIMAAKALLDRDPHPTREEIHAAMSGNLCRCTGYTKIEEAIVAASKVI